MADSTRTVMLFEISLPTRYDLPRVDVQMDLLVPSDRTLLERLTSGSRRADAHQPRARYRPRPSFPQHVAAIRSGTRTSPRPHLVAAFIRTFRNGQQPSDEARSREPARVRRMLKPNQTWVRESSRGGRPLVDELQIHLSRYSALADALGFADAYPDHPS